MRGAHNYSTPTTGGPLMELIKVQSWYAPELRHNIQNDVMERQLKDIRQTKLSSIARTSSLNNNSLPFCATNSIFLIISNFCLFLISHLIIAQFSNLALINRCGRRYIVYLLWFHSFSQTPLSFSQAQT